MWTVDKRYEIKNDIHHPTNQSCNHIAVCLLDDGTVFFYINGKQCQIGDKRSFEGFQGETENKIVVKYWSENAHDVLCISDFRLIPGCLTRLEIEAASEQPPVPLDMIKVGTFWKNKIKGGDRE
jgi:hypothetical protein